MNKRHFDTTEERPDNLFGRSIRGENFARIRVPRSNLLRFGSVVLAAFLTLVIYSVPFQWGNNEFMYISQVILGDEENVGIFASGFPNLPAQLFGFLSSPFFSWLPIETATLVLRLLGYFVLSVGLGILSYAIRMGPLGLALGLSVFLVSGQEYFGQEAIVMGIESKVPAYGLGLSSIGALLSGRSTTAWILALVATLFHPLVGLIFFGVLFTLSVLKRIEGESLAIRVPLATLSIAVGYITILRIATIGDSVDETLARKIYSLVRHPHHLAPFGGTNPVDGSEIAGWFSYNILIYPAVVAILLYLALRFESNPTLRIFLKLAFWLHLWIPVALALAWLDKAHQLLGPLYIFRPLSLLPLLSLMGLAAFTLERSKTLHFRQFFAAVLLSWIILGAPRPSFENLALPKWAEVTDSGTALIEVLWSETSSRDTIAVDFKNLGTQTGLTEQNFEVAAGRGLIAVEKFVPTRDSDILTWWSALQEREKLLNRDCNASSPGPFNFMVLAESDVPHELEPEAVAKRDGFVVLPLRDEVLRNWCNSTPQ